MHSRGRDNRCVLSCKLSIYACLSHASISCIACFAPTWHLREEFCCVPGRYQASRDDLAVYSAIDKAPSASEYPHVARWYSHIEALLKKE